MRKRTSCCPRFAAFPPRCIAGTAGAEFVPQSMAGNYVRIPNDWRSSFPGDILQQQIVLEKQTLDILQAGTRATWSNGFLPGPNVVFSVWSPNTAFDSRSKAFSSERVSVVSDAIATCDPMPGIEP